MHKPILFAGVLFAVVILPVHSTPQIKNYDEPAPISRSEFYDSNVEEAVDSETFRAEDEIWPEGMGEFDENAVSMHGYSIEDEDASDYEYHEDGEKSSHPLIDEMDRFSDSKQGGLDSTVDEAPQLLDEDAENLNDLNHVLTDDNVDIYGQSYRQQEDSFDSETDTNDAISAYDDYAEYSEHYDESNEANDNEDLIVSGQSLLFGKWGLGGKKVVNENPLPQAEKNIGLDKPKVSAKQLDENGESGTPNDSIRHQGERNPSRNSTLTVPSSNEKVRNDDTHPAKGQADESKRGLGVQSVDHSKDLNMETGHLSNEQVSDKEGFLDDAIPASHSSTNREDVLPTEEEWKVSEEDEQFQDETSLHEGDGAVDEWDEEDLETLDSLGEDRELDSEEEMNFDSLQDEGDLEMEKIYRLGLNDEYFEDEEVGLGEVDDGLIDVAAHGDEVEGLEDFEEELNDDAMGKDVIDVQGQSVVKGDVEPNSPYLLEVDPYENGLDGHLAMEHEDISLIGQSVGFENDAEDENPEQNIGGEDYETFDDDVEREDDEDSLKLLEESLEAFEA